MSERRKRPPVGPAAAFDHTGKGEEAKASSASAAAGATAQRCAHCGDPVPRGLLVAGASEQFCCNGCKVAREVITGCGLDRYYALREAADAGAADGARAGRRDAQTARRDYAEFDDEAFAARHVFRRADGMATCDLFLEGVHCSACLWLLERLPRVVPGVLESRLDLRRSLLRVTWDPSVNTLSAAARALHRLGYPPHPARAAQARTVRAREERRQLVRIGVAGACAGNVMLLALAMYAGLFDQMDPAHLSLFRWTSMGLSVLAMAWPGRVFFRGAWAALRTRTMHLDLPIAVGLAAGLVWGVVNTVRGTGEVYFDSLSVLVFALLLGRYVQQRQQRWSADAVELLFSLTPSSASRIEPGPTGEIVRTVPLEAVNVDDRLLVAAGDTIPADGIIEEGTSRIDRALLTGESAPVAVGVGDAVPAGAANLSSPIRVRVQATGEATRVGRLMRLVADASAQRAPIVRLADRMAGWFTVAALALAAATCAGWWLLDPANPHLAIERAVALLIVTCPCGLGLATPLAVTVAMGRAARMRILIKGGEAIERLAQARRRGRQGRRGRRGERQRGIVYLDKTGTITEGVLGVAEHAGDLRAIRLAAAAERDVTHPVAEALRRFASEHGDVDDPTVADQHHVLGGGVSALVDGERIVVGSMAFVTAAIGGRCGPAEHLLAVASSAASRGMSPILVAREGALVAVAALGDRIRPGAAQAIATIRSLGWEVGVLSGDDPGTVRRVAALVGLETAEGDREHGLPDTADATDRVLGGQTPERKLALVEAARAVRPTIMVGDGVNDAAALAAATVGVAVHGGAEASLLAADVHLGRPGLWGVVELLEGSRRTISAVHRNLAVSLGYNVLAAALCATGAISPLIAAVIMPISSLTVVALSVKARTFAARDATRDRHQFPAAGPSGPRPPETGACPSIAVAERTPAEPQP